jgi:hypothetical protein
VIAVLIALAAAIAACGGGGGNSDANAKEVVDTATLQGIESGDLELSLKVKAGGAEGGDLDVSLSGPFESSESTDLPQLDMTAKVGGTMNGKNIDFEGGLVLLPNSAYVNYQGTEYEVDPTTFSFVESTLKQAQQQGGAEAGSAGTTACERAAGKLELGSLMDNLRNEGGVDVGGTETTKISGDLNVAGAIDSLIKILEDPACSSQLNSAGSLPSTSQLRKAQDKVKNAVKTAHMEVYVGDDGIVRRVTAQLAIEPPKGSGKGPQSVELELDLTLTGVNEEQEISTPEKAKPLNDLFLKLGVNPLELLNALQGGGGGAGNLLEGLGEGIVGGESSSGGGGAGEGGGGETSGGGESGQQAYLKCLQGASSTSDIERCASKL